VIGRLLFICVNTFMAELALPGQFYIGLVYSLCLLIIFKRPKKASVAQSCQPEPNTRHSPKDAQFDMSNHHSSNRREDIYSMPAIHCSIDDNDMLFSSSVASEHHSMSFYEDDFTSSISSPSFNPATGLPMIGAVDIHGNTYGSSSMEDMSTVGSGLNDWASHSIGFDDSLSASAFDDSFSSTSSGFSDNFSSGFDDSSSFSDSSDW